MVPLRGAARGALASEYTRRFDIVLPRLAGGDVPGGAAPGWYRRRAAQASSAWSCHLADQRGVPEVTRRSRTAERLPGARRGRWSAHWVSRGEPCVGDQHRPGTLRASALDRLPGALRQPWERYGYSMVPAHVVACRVIARSGRNPGPRRRKVFAGARRLRRAPAPACDAMRSSTWHPPRKTRRADGADTLRDTPDRCGGAVRWGGAVARWGPVIPDGPVMAVDSSTMLLEKALASRVATNARTRITAVA